MKLRADIAYAIGHARGCGHPIDYLEHNYPDLVRKRLGLLGSLNIESISYD